MPEISPSLKDTNIASRAPSIHTDTLGFYAVKAEDTETIRRLSEGDGPEQMDVTYQSPGSLGQARRRLAKLPKVMHESIDDTLDKTSPPYLCAQVTGSILNTNEYPSLLTTEHVADEKAATSNTRWWRVNKANKRSKPKKQTPTQEPYVSRWLTFLLAEAEAVQPEDSEVEMAAKGRLQRQYDGRLINFLQGHVHRMDSLNRLPEVRRAFKREADEFCYGVLRGEKEGWLFPRSTKRVRELILGQDNHRGLSQMIADEFSTNFQGILGYYVLGSSEIAISASSAALESSGRAVNLDNVLYSISIAAKHEMGHAALGSLREIAGLKTVWLDEAVNEHTRLVIDGVRKLDDVMVTDEDERTSYHEARNMLGTLISLSRGMLHMRDFTLAFSASFTEHSKLEAKKLEKKIDDAFNNLAVLDIINEHLQRERAKAIMDNPGLLNGRLDAIAEGATFKWLTTYPRLKLANNAARRDV